MWPAVGWAGAVARVRRAWPHTPQNRVPAGMPEPHWGHECPTADGCSGIDCLRPGCAGAALCIWDMSVICDTCTNCRPTRARNRWEGTVDLCHDECARNRVARSYDCRWSRPAATVVTPAGNAQVEEGDALGEGSLPPSSFGAGYAAPAGGDPHAVAAGENSQLARVNRLAAGCFATALFLGLLVAPVTLPLSRLAQRRIAETGEAGAGLARAAGFISAVYLVIGVVVVGLYVYRTAVAPSG